MTRIGARKVNTQLSTDRIRTRGSDRRGGINRTSGAVGNVSERVIREW